MTTFDPIRFKEQEKAGFNLVAERYEKGISQAEVMFQRLLENARILEGMNILDVATGTGVIARKAARLTGSSGHVTGIDIADQALEVARRRAQEEDLNNLSFQVMDAEHMTFEDNSFDRVLISLGLMHFPHPEKALSEGFRVLKPESLIIVGVWGEKEDVHFLRLALDALQRNLPPPKIERPSMFRFGKPEVMTELLAQAGFRNIATEKVMLTARVTDAADYWQVFLDMAGITTVALAKQPPEVLEKLIADTVEYLEPFRKGDIYEINSTMLVAAGEK
jgi:ubiquinone/menaquinone biosynthesis C-methylase UbiE